jgi:hypothetical protein
LKRENNPKEGKYDALSNVDVLVSVLGHLGCEAREKYYVITVARKDKETVVILVLKRRFTLRLLLIDIYWC